MVTVALSWLLLLLLLGHCSIHDKGHAFIYFQKDCCLYISSLLWDCGIALSKDLRKFVGAVCVMEHHKVKSSYRSQQIILVLYSLGLAFHRLRFMVGRRTSWKLHCWHGNHQIICLATFDVWRVDGRFWVRERERERERGEENRFDPARLPDCSLSCSLSPWLLFYCCFILSPLL